MMKKITLGLDLSLRASGYVKLENDKIIEQKLIKSKPVDKFPVNELERLMKIRDEINVEGVDLAIVEGMAFMIRKTVALVQLSALNYMIREKCYINNVPFIIVAPTTLKRFCTGKGNSPKELILLEIYKRYGESFNDNNLGDAFGLARIGELLLKDISNDNLKVPKFQKETVDLLKKQLK